jgi:hypothetical protein
MLSAPPCAGAHAVDNIGTPGSVDEHIQTTMLVDNIGDHGCCNGWLRHIKNHSPRAITSYRADGLFCLIQVLVCYYCIGAFSR